MEEDDIILSASAGEDTFTLGNIDLNDILTSDTIDLGNMSGITGTGSVLTMSGTGGTSYTYSNGNWATTSGVWPTVYTLANTNPAVKIQGNADVDGDLTVQGVSVLDTLKKINERLSILVPDPARLEKYTALKQAYEHYKTLEALCIEQDDTDTAK